MKQIITLFLLLTFCYVKSQKLSKLDSTVLNKLDCEVISTLIEERINKLRVDSGLQTLTINLKLKKGALTNSKNSVKYNTAIHTQKGKFSEITLMFANVLSVKGLTNEFLAKIFVSGWLDSPPHKKLIYQKDVKEFGCGTVFKIKRESLNWAYFWSSVRFH